MAPLQGLTGLYAPDPQDTSSVMDEGVLEAKANPIAAEHGQYGSQHLGYSGPVPTAIPYSPMAVYDGFDMADSMMYGGLGFAEPGAEHDVTPETHSAPYPRGIVQQSWETPDGLAAAGEQMILLHGPDLGGPGMYAGNAIGGREEITNYTTDDYIAPNENYLAADVPGQLRAPGDNSAGGYGGGNADPTQGYGVLNTLEEFNAGHSIRRIQHDRMPWDFTNTHGEQDVPFFARHPVQQMPLDGPDSPYFEQGSIDGANVVWEGRIGNPSPYEQPAEPSFAAAADTGSESPMAWG